jgi:D-alanyl-D-alanine carboxypeptidase (penicillin-binding protein 5/6)
MQRVLRFIFLPLFFLSKAEGTPLKVEVSAASAILMNAETGAILFAKEPHLSSYPASITKIATALYALENKQGVLDEAVTVTHEAVRKISPVIKQAAFDDHPSYLLETDGTLMGLKVGETLSLKALLYGMMLVSGNDAANAVAQHISGDIDQFVSELNLFLRSKGIQETQFLNPHGLHHPKHYTTAYDMALMTKEALKHRYFQEIVKTVRFSLPQTNKQLEREIVQYNRLLKPGPYYYSKAIGVKTGHTEKAGDPMVAAAEHEGRTLIAVLLGCRGKTARYQDAIKLFNAAFAETKVARMLFTKKFDHFSRDVKGAKTSVEASLLEDVEISFYPAEEPYFKSRVSWLPVHLPILQGQKVGDLEIMTEKGVILKSTPLLAVKRVDKMFWRGVLDGCIAYKKTLILSVLLLNVLTFLFYYFKKSQKVMKT